tara:strand:+ start:144 stop:437 length:294 start_codon:yes stop_codon:yes gene_type:complete
VPRKRNGETVRMVAQAIDEDPGLTDLAISAQLDVSEQAVSDARRKSGIPGIYARRRVADRLGRCWRCMRSYRIQDGLPFASCPACGEVIEVSTVSVR